MVNQFFLKNEFLDVGQSLILMCRVEGSEKHLPCKPGGLLVFYRGLLNMQAADNKNQIKDLK